MEIGSRLVESLTSCWSCGPHWDHGLVILANFSKDRDDEGYPPNEFDQPIKHSGNSSNGNGAVKRTLSMDNAGSKPGEGVLSPPAVIESEAGKARSEDWPIQNVSEQSKWIHRDKLARIESQELQAAGIFVPRAKMPSKHRSQSRLRRGTESSEHSQSNKSGKVLSEIVNAPSWDLRTPEEIAEEEANAYFTSNGLSGGSRIPVAKTSPAPIPLDYLERASPAGRKLPDLPNDEPILYATKTRSRSASTTQRENGKRSVTDTSPKKTAGNARKTSAPPKTPPMTNNRPKTRSGQSNHSGSGGSGTRPSTRSGERQMEGDPPWEINSYKPDPRLPPDQQLLPTVARRLQQEKLEREGKFGDVYDKDFRPLNEKAFLRPAEFENNQTEQQREWPLRADGGTKSPTIRQGSYSTMPKISDKPPASPIGSPRMPPTAQNGQRMSQNQEETQTNRPQENEADEKEKGGCGCCVVM